MPEQYAGGMTSAESAPAGGPGSGARRIVVSGATGLIGGKLLPALSRAGWAPERLTRHAPAGSDIAWNPATGTIDAARLEGAEAVIHLAGENIGAHRWTAERKARIRDSRITGTTLLATTLAGLDRTPRVLLSVSAIGIFGDRGDELLNESSPVGTDFLAEVGEAWEASADPAQDAGIRVVHPRLGVVLHPDGGALERLLGVFRLGAGGKIGNGEQWLSWIARTDVVSALHFLLRDEDFRGPVNVVAPNPETNASFSKTLGHVIHRPALATVPAMAVRLMLGGEMANATVLASQRVRPKALDEYGFRFQFPHLEGALRHELADAAH